MEKRRLINDAPVPGVMSTLAKLREINCRL